MCRLTRLPAFIILLAVLLPLTGCLYDSAPSGPVRSVDSWLLGQWATKDKAQHSFTATLTPASSDHYKVIFQKKSGETHEFDGWISRVDDFSILVLKSLNQDDSYGKYSLYHYELLSQGPPPLGGIGANRIRLSELQLDESTRSLDPVKLRSAIRAALKSGTLLTPYDVSSSRKGELIEQKIFAAEAAIASSQAESHPKKIPESAIKDLMKLKEKMAAIKEVPGSIIWTKTGSVTFHGETF